MKSRINDYSEIDLSFTIGLIAGEGSFFITFMRDDRYAHDVYFVPKMAVSMGEKEEEMLQNQCQLYGLGTINKTQKGFQWVLSSREECHKLIEIIDEYLEQHSDSEFFNATKYNAYKNWRTALDLLRPGRQLTSDEVIRLAELRDDINYIRATSSIPTEEIRQLVRTADHT
jgi:hypothetical protein